MKIKTFTIPKESELFLGITGSRQERSNYIRLARNHLRKQGKKVIGKKVINY